MKVAIGIDKYKLPTFTKRLEEAGFAIKTLGGVTEDTLILTVQTEDPAALEKVVRAANIEATAKRSLS